MSSEYEKLPPLCTIFIKTQTYITAVTKHRFMAAVGRKQVCVCINVELYLAGEQEWVP